MGHSLSDIIEDIIMAEIKFTYFDLRVKGEAARLLLAYSGLEWEDDRVVLPWDDATVWSAMKPSMPWGQLPCLTYKGEKICQSMSICRFVAREAAIEANYNAWYSPNRR